MRTPVLAAILLCAASSARAGELSAGGPDCGGDAFSSAQVIEHRPPRRGPIVAVPETLCADLVPQQPPTRVDIIANPILLPRAGEGGPGAPYGDRPPVVGGPPRPRRP